MPNVLSPLRYPGGKSALFGFVDEIISQNKLFGYDYVEPFAGGAGLALRLLQSNKVEKIHLNDLDVPIHSFWRSVQKRTDELCERVRDAEFSIDEWEKQCHALDDSHSSFLDRGFAALYLNRVNYSGILRARPIGGLKQMGPCKMDSRFKKNKLIEKINWIAGMRDRIHLYRMDANKFIEKTLAKPISEKSLVYLDPPYCSVGGQLYLNKFGTKKHERLKDLLKDIKQKWFLTCDNSSEARKIYSDFSQQKIHLNYSANVKQRESEMLIMDEELIFPKTWPGKLSARTCRA